MAFQFLAHRAPLVRSRPIVRNGTIKTDTGKLIRGCAMSITSADTTPRCTDPAVLDSIRALGLNCLRIDVKCSQASPPQTIAHQLATLDTCVNLAATKRLYVMPHPSVHAGEMDTIGEMEEFWAAAAPRYKNRTHVFFEQYNEPVSGPGTWGSANNWTPAVINRLRACYDTIRALAPQTPVAIFSTPNFAPTTASWLDTGGPIKDFEAAGEPVDWTKTLVGYHHYDGTMGLDNSGPPWPTRGMNGVGDIKSAYPILMTETNYWLEPGLDAEYVTLLRDYERDGVSWFSLGGKSDNVRITEIVNDLASAGYVLPKE